MSFWTGLFGASSLVREFKNAGDDIVFTAQERAAHFIELLKHLEPFKIAQRWLAIIVVGSYVSVWLVAALIFSLSALADPGFVCVTGQHCEISKAHQLQQLAKDLGEMNNSNLGIPTGIILSFYFAGGMANGWIESWKKGK